VRHVGHPARPGRYERPGHPGRSGHRRQGPGHAAPHHCRVDLKGHRREQRHRVPLKEPDPVRRRTESHARRRARGLHTAHRRLRPRRRRSQRKDRSDAREPPHGHTTLPLRAAGVHPGRTL
jgi:hypothetical protein